MAKRKKAQSKTGAVGGALGRGVGATWRFIAKSLGKSVRFIARGARDLDPAHQRDGIAFLILILALIATAGTWFHSDNLVGRAVYSLYMVDLVGLVLFLPLFSFTSHLDYFACPRIQKLRGESSLAHWHLQCHQLG